MKITNRYYYYFVNQLGFVLILWLILYLIKVEYVTTIVIIYILFQTIRYYLTFKNFVIEKNGIYLSPSESFLFADITDIYFVEKYFILYVNQKIVVTFKDGTKKTINCNGLNTEDDENKDSFYNTYKYTDNLFTNTHYKNVPINKSSDKK